MKKYLMLIFFVLGSLLSFAKEYKMLVPSGLPTMALSYMMADRSTLSGEPLYVILPKANDAMMTEMIKKTPDIAVIPSNLAAQLYEKQGEYKIIGSLTSSSFYILGRERLKDIKDLKKQKIFSFGRGLTPDVVLQTILKKAGIEKEVEIQYLSSPVEALQMYTKFKHSYVFLPEPMVSQTMDKMHSFVLFSMREEWIKYFPETTGFPQAVVIVKKDLLKDYKLMSELDQALQESVSFLHNSPKRRDVLAKHGFQFSEEVLDNILQRANIEWKSIASEKKNFQQYYKILEQENSKLIGGKLPEESIYAR